MEIIRFSTALKLDDTVSLSLVYLPCSDSGVAAVEPKKSVSPVHLFTYCLCNPWRWLLLDSNSSNWGVLVQDI
jgi:hypothetical protein